MLKRALTMAPGLVAGSVLLFAAAAQSGVATAPSASPSASPEPQSESKGVASVRKGFPLSLNRLAFRHLIKRAELIFLGTVTGVDYRMSSATGDVEALPHTFVTFKIEEILKGNTESATITLRFQGGRMEGGPGEFGYLTGSLIPLFDLGDRDILLVKGNGKSICPLVGLRDGRLRVIEGRIYTDLGYPIGLFDELEWSLPFLRDDVIQPVALFDRFLNPRSGIDKHLSSQLRTAVHESMRAAVKGEPYSAAVTHAKYLLVRNLNDIIGVDSLLIPSVPSQGSPSIPETIPKRLLSNQELEGVPVREQTKRLLAVDRQSLSPSEGVLLNRLLLEDLYYPYIIRSLTPNVVSLPFNAGHTPRSVLDAVMNHEALCAGCTFSRNWLGTDGRGDGIATHRSLEPERTITKPSADEFLKYLRLSIQRLHTQDELTALPSIHSVRIDEPFYVKAAKPVQLQMNLAPLEALTDRPSDSARSEEEKAMIRSGFNPVLKRPNVK